MKNIGKYVLMGLGVVFLEWVFLAIFSEMFNGLSQEGAVAVGSAFFLAFEMVVCTGVIVSKIDKKKDDDDR